MLKKYKSNPNKMIKKHLKRKFLSLKNQFKKLALPAIITLADHMFNKVKVSQEKLNQFLKEIQNKINNNKSMIFNNQKKKKMIR